MKLRGSGIAALVALTAAAAQPLLGVELGAAEHALESAQVSLRLNHTFEGLGGTREGPLAGSLTDFEVHWQPAIPRFPRGGAFTAVYSAWSLNRTSTSPDLQGVSSLTTEPFRRWREAYFELPFGRAVRLKAGKVDANTEFAVMEFGGDLSNASAGVSPTLRTMPSYPDGAPSLNLFVVLGHGVSGGAGVYRTQGGGVYQIGEATVRWNRRRPGRVAAGVWHQAAAPSGSEDRTATSGTYFVLEQTVLRRGSDGGMKAFARFSATDEFAAPASLHNVYGASWTGFGSRHTDTAGFAILYLLPTFNAPAPRSEVANEAYYKFPINNYMAVKFDIQHVRRPGGADANLPFTVAAVRLFFSMSVANAEQ